MSLLVESEALSPAGEAEEIELQLNRLLESHHFARSSRYPALLQFLVQQVQMGNAARLKERHVGIKVFHRPLDYDTGSDPIVRVTAGEVRKRIAQYYQEPEHQGELRIDLPLGSYVPRFLPARLAASSSAEGTDGRATSQHLVQAESSPIPVDHALLEPGDAISEPAHAEMRADESASQPAKYSQIAAEIKGEDAGGSTIHFRRWRVISLLAAALVLGAGLALGPTAVNALRDEVRTRSLHQLWAPMEAQGPMLLVIGDHSLDDNGHSMGIAPITTNSADTVLTQVNRRSQVPLEDLISLDKIHSFLTRDTRQYRDKGAAEATLEDLRGGPAVLFAGFDNRWAVQLSQQLPYKLVPNLDSNYASIVDSKNPAHSWTLNFAKPVNEIVSDYGIVARYFDPMLEHNVLIVAGIGSMGTAAASEFVTEDRFSREIVTAAPSGWKDGNFEIVLGAPVVDGQAGPPRIIASAYW